MDLPTSAGIGATLTFYLGHEWTTASITIFVVGFLLMQSCSGRWGALMVLSSAARVVSIKLCVVGKIISTLSDASCLVTCNLQPAFCTNWLVLLPVCFCRSQHGETDRYFFWALQLTALHPTSTIFLEEPKPQLPVTAVVDSPFAATRHSAGVVKNYGYALAPKIVAPHLKELLDDPMVGSLMGWFVSLASPHY